MQQRDRRLMVFNAVRDTRGDVAPRYRFHGSTPPRPGSRTPVRAQITAAADGAGTATIRLYDPIDSWGGDWGVSAKEFRAALDELPDGVSQIMLHINSPGGEVYEGIAILNALRQHPARVTAIVDGLAASAASFLACGADEVVMARNSQMMIHDAWGICIGDAETMRDTGRRLDQISDNIATVYQEKAGGTLASWRDAMLAETWYSADEAVTAGLADRVDAPPAADDEAQNRFDLTAFRHQGRTAAPAPPVPQVAARATGSAPAAARSPHGDVQQLRHRLVAAKHGLELAPARADAAADTSILTQALGWFTAIDSVVDQALEGLSAHLGVPNPDMDDDEIGEPDSGAA